MFEFCMLEYLDIFYIDILTTYFENVARHFDMSNAVVSLDIFRQRHAAITNVVNNPIKIGFWMVKSFFDKSFALGLTRKLPGTLLW